MSNKPQPKIGTQLKDALARAASTPKSAWLADIICQPKSTWKNVLPVQKQVVITTK